MDFYDDVMMEDNILFTVFSGTTIYIGRTNNVTH